MENKNLLSGNFDCELFKARIKEASGHSKLKDIAADCHINPSTFTHKCQGIGLMYDDLLLFASKYNCSIDYLLGLTDHIAINSKNNILLTEIISIFNILFEKGVFTLESDTLSFSNDLLVYFYSEIRKMRLLVNDGTLTQEDFDTWLKGFSSDFADYDYLSPEMIERLEAELKKLKNKDFCFLSFDEWKKKNKDTIELWEMAKSPRMLFKCYVEDTYYFSDILNNAVKGNYDETIDALLKNPTVKKIFDDNIFKKGKAIKGYKTH